MAWAAFPSHNQGAGSRVEIPGNESVAIADAGSSDIGLTCHGSGARKGINIIKKNHRIDWEENKLASIISICVEMSYTYVKCLKFSIYAAL